MAELRRLERARELVISLLKDFRNSGFTKQTFMTPPDKTSYYVRLGFIHELCAISENLELKMNSPLRGKHPELFQVASFLRGQRNILTHGYGLPSPKVDWSLVWATFDTGLEDLLIPPLDRVIEEEEGEEGGDEEKGEEGDDEDPEDDDEDPEGL